MNYDLIFIGGGLASLLAAFRIAQLKPTTTILIVESQQKLGGDHIWSFHLSDVPTWLHALADVTWPRYEVRFPDFSKTVEMPYGSLKSETLANNVKKIATIRTATRVDSFTNSSITLSNNDTIYAKCVVDSRGLDASEVKFAGYQKFIGRVFEFKNPHSISSPVVFDASVNHTDGFRFFYVLPLSPSTLLVENTFYSNNPLLETETIQDEIERYLKTIVPESSTCTYEETGTLALPISWDFKKNATKRLAIGLRGGFFNFVTGYSTPMAAQVADTLAKLDELNPGNVAKALDTLRNENEGQRRYELILNKLMFLGSNEKNRVNIFSRFYKMPVTTMERFYAGKLTTFDKARMLIEKPPIPISSAIKALLGKGVA